MGDVVERLQKVHDAGVVLRLTKDGSSAERDPLCKEAADEIAQLLRASRRT